MEIGIWLPELGAKNIKDGGTFGMTMHKLREKLPSRSPCGEWDLVKMPLTSGCWDTVKTEMTGQGPMISDQVCGELKAAKVRI